MLNRGGQEALVFAAVFVLNIIQSVSTCTLQYRYRNEEGENKILRSSHFLLFCVFNIEQLKVLRVLALVSNTHLSMYQLRHVI